MLDTGRTALGLLVLAATLAFSAPAMPQAAGDASQAETLFYDGRKAFEAGDNATACKKFAESLALLRRASTLVNLSQCESKLGKLADALVHAQDALSLLPPNDERMGPAKELVDDLSVRVPRLTLKLPADLPAGASVLVDGKEIARERWSQPISIDAGEHSVTLRAPSKEDAVSKVTLAERDRKDLALTFTAPSAKGGATAGSKDPPVDPDKDAPDSGRATRRTAGFIAGGVGVAGLVAAGVTGGLIVANDSTIKSNCPDKVCNAVGRDTIAQSNMLAIANYVAWGVGGAGIAAGAVLILTSLGGGKEKPAVSVLASPSSAIVVWQGSFQ